MNKKLVGCLSSKHNLYSDKLLMQLPLCIQNRLSIEILSWKIFCTIQIMEKSKLSTLDSELNVIKMKGLILFAGHLIIWIQILLKEINIMGKPLMFGLLV